MSRQFSPLAVVSLLLSMLVVGCRPQQPFYFNEDGDLSHYVGVATNIDYPDAEVASLGDVEGAEPPLTLENPEPKEMWDLTLQDTMRITLDNSKVMRNLGGVTFGQGGAQGDPTTLLSQASIIPSIYDPARAESDPRYGVEGALAAFDAQFTSSVFWERLDTPQNYPRNGSLSSFRPDVNEADTGTFQAQLSKTNMTGGTVALSHEVGYEWGNSTYRQWPSAWTSNLVAQVRQPLLQGAGVQFNSIASPNSIPGFYNGVMIARLRTDIALTEFEAAVRDLTRDTERAYWELYYAYRQLDTAIAGRNSALQTWRQVYAKFQVGGRGGSAQDEAQARQQYYLFRGAVEQALSNLYKTENHLRYIMGLAVTDGRLIRPADEPTTAKVTFDWYEIHAEALTRSVELRQQKWVVKQRELELIAAKNYLLPQLDAIAQYRWLGLGDLLIDPSNPTDPATGEPNNAYGSLTSGRYQEWQLGLQLNVPIGFRKEMAGVRNAQLNLARERSVLQEQELELSHQMGGAIRELNDSYAVTGTQFNRRRSAEDEVNAVRAAYEQGVVTLDLLLLAQQRLAEAESAYFRSLIDYNEAIANIHYRKGSLLEYDGVCLAEGPWPAKAYFDATRLARARDASYYLNYGITQPRVISRGPVNQHPHNADFLDASMGLKPGQPEAIPTPAPEPSVVPEPETPAKPQPSSTQQTAKPAATGLERVSYQQPATTGQSAGAAGWKSTKTPGTTHESVTHPASADADRTAAGWKRVQR